MHAIANIVRCVLGSIVAAEVLGYVLHRLMHGGWISWLSASHMKHHMILAIALGVLSAFDISYLKIS